MAKQDVVAMLLAGGQGSRLGVLTDEIAKPAVPFGSRYRIIDFPLSNCTNSGIETVGVLTQYQPLELNAYVGNGHSWDLDRNTGGLSILPPYQSSARKDWYKGTANAIYQNILFVDRYQPEFVVVLSGDHIYKMDYAAMIKAHIDAGATATIAVIEVPWEETHRFGIMNTNADGIITEFEEKPKKAKNNLASMGVYVFNWEELKRELIADEENPDSDNDFGKNIIPGLLAKNKKLLAYTFSGYWKDVGTVFSLWEANMDLLDSPEAINLADSGWRIYSRNPIRPPHYIAQGAIVERSVLTDGDVIMGSVYHSVVSSRVVVEEGAEVRDCFLMPGARICRGARLERCIVGIDTVIGENSTIGLPLPGANTDYVHKLCSDGISVIQSGIVTQDGIALAGNSMVRVARNSKANAVFKESSFGKR